MWLLSSLVVALEFFTDTGTCIGFGVYGDLSFSHALPDKFLSLPAEIQSVAHFELYPVVGVCVLISKLLSMTNLLFCLNEAAINKGHFSVPFIYLFILLWLTLLFSAAHLISRTNKMGTYL